MQIDTKSLLLRQRDDILRKLVDLAVQDRKPSIAEKLRIEAQQLISELTKTDRLLSIVDEPEKSRKYAGFKKAIEGVMKVLDDLGRPATEGEVIRSMIDGGFRGGIPGTELQIHRSIMIFLNGTGKAKGYIKQVGGLIGKYEWEDSLFKAR